MYRSGRIWSELRLRDDLKGVDLYKRSNGEKADRIFDEHGMFEYSYKFSTQLELSRWEKTEPQRVVLFDRDMTDDLYEIMVRDFAYELAHRMKYSNYKVLERHGINPGQVIWDEKNKP